MSNFSKLLLLAIIAFSSATFAVQPNNSSATSLGVGSGIGRPNNNFIYNGSVPTASPGTNSGAAQVHNNAVINNAGSVQTNNSMMNTTPTSTGSTNQTNNINCVGDTCPQTTYSGTGSGGTTVNMGQ